MKLIMLRVSAGRAGRIGMSRSMRAPVISSLSPTMRATSGASMRGSRCIPGLSSCLQQQLFRAALDELALIGEPVNQVLEVDLDGDDVTIVVYDLPPGEP
jgi:hypothetical protein